MVDTANQLRRLAGQGGKRAVAQPQQRGGDPVGFKAVSGQGRGGQGQRVFGAQAPGPGPLAFGGAELGAAVTRGLETGCAAVLVLVLVSKASMRMSASRPCSLAGMLMCTSASVGS